MMDATQLLPHQKPPRRNHERGWIVSALESAEKAVALGLPGRQNHFVVQGQRHYKTIQVYRELGSRCRYPLHLGLTEGGHG